MKSIQNIIQAVSWYGYNTAPLTIIKDVYGEHLNDSYKQEKLKIFENHGILRLFSEIDENHRDKI